MPNQPVRTTWELRSAEDWSALRARFGISHVLVKGAWKLQLPVVARSPRLALHRIPEPTATP